MSSVLLWRTAVSAGLLFELCASLWLFCPVGEAFTPWHECDLPSKGNAPPPRWQGHSRFSGRVIRPFQHSAQGVAEGCNPHRGRTTLGCIRVLVLIRSTIGIPSPRGPREKWLPLDLGPGEGLTSTAPALFRRPMLPDVGSSCPTVRCHRPYLPRRVSTGIGWL